MSIFSRLFKVTQAEAHDLIDKIENPIKMFEQAIRDLKKDLSETMKALAQVKAQGIGMGRDKKKYTEQAEDWERKTVLLLQKVEEGSISREEGERLAKEALLKKDDALKKANTASVNAEKQTELVGKLTVQVEKLQRTISNQENELITLKARARTAQSMKKINKQLSGIDSSSTINMLERMKQKIDEDESLAEAYGEMEGLTNNLDSEIDRALSSNDTTGDLLLAEFKSKLKK
ncbi:MAG: PspA/IM30 family protein [Candidatus Marinimicrobia bacterium]|nr:PspA/IM30 family protein [Candidatus Neomarinimicrobiota bacterium]